LNQINQRLGCLRGIGPADVSVVIPAFNEEKTILQTLVSLSESKSKFRVEIVVVDNNCTDRTAELVTSAGAICVKEVVQGYMHARNKGLFSATGRFILNADADTIYPPDWIDSMILPMESSGDIALVYGLYSFLPSGNRPRLIYYFYELVSDWARSRAKRVKDEAAFVMGANSAFRREFALTVDGYKHPPGANEDGFLALKLRKYGKLFFNRASIVWTSDRSLISEGNLFVTTSIRIKKYAKRFWYS
jgi:glycosyltransferase involved in cell wall biosynthesis